MSQKIQPLVSIILDNYNYEHFVDKAIDSALNQTHQNIEIIVVDDGSTDGSWNVIQKYSDKIIAFRKENSGQSSAFNKGFDLSNGDIICFLDSDDIFLPEKASNIVKAIRE